MSQILPRWNIYTPATIDIYRYFDATLGEDGEWCIGMIHRALDDDRTREDIELIGRINIEELEEDISLSSVKERLIEIVLENIVGTTNENTEILRKWWRYDSEDISDLDRSFIYECINVRLDLDCLPDP